MPEISQNIALLRHCVEESANHRIKTSTDFTFLSGVIQERLGETIATSTLKRLWGYVDGYASTRAATLNILALCEGREGLVQGSSSGCLAAQTQRGTESTRLPGPLAGVCIIDSMPLR